MKLVSPGMSAWLLMFLTFVAQAQSHTTASGPVAQTEAIYADVLDAYGAFSTIDSGLMKGYEGKDRKAWERTYHDRRAALVARLAKLYYHLARVYDRLGKPKAAKKEREQHAKLVEAQQK